MALTTSYWPATDEEPLLETTAGGTLREVAASIPDKIALIEGTADPGSRRKRTYAELLAESEAMARALLALFKPGDHVAIWAPNCIEWIVLQYGLALAGMVLVTVNPAYRESELEYVLKQSRARGWFFAPTYRGVDMRAKVDAVVTRLPDLDVTLALDELPEMVAKGSSVRPLPTVMPGDSIMIQYTSGTTGFPKGALLTHHGVTNNARHMAILRGVGDGTIDISAMPLFHTGGCVVSVLGTLQTRGTLVLVPEFEPNLYLDLIEQERAQFTLAVPTMLIALLEAQRATARDLSSMEVIISGGAVVPIEIVKRIKREFGCEFSIIFGQTETSPVVTSTRLDDTPEDTSESLGRALPHAEVKIVDTETGEIVQVGETGEFCTRGYLTMQEYFDMPEATANTIDADGWLHTGDLCSMDERGYFYVQGRLKDMIIRGGENVYPREIEDVLFKHPAIAEAAVVGIPDERWGEQVAAFIRVAKGRATNADELHDFMREHLAPHKTPKIWIELDAYPMTPSGKIQKYRLVEMFESGDLKPNMAGENAA